MELYTLLPKKDTDWDRTCNDGSYGAPSFPNQTPEQERTGEVSAGIVNLSPEMVRDDDVDDDVGWI